MMRERFARNPYYQEYEHLLIRLHEAIAAENEEEADRIREEMDRPERHLNRAEMERLGGLSADLYMLQDDEIYEQNSFSAHDIRAGLAQARQDDNDEKLLFWLRQGDAGFEQSQIAYLRSLAYQRLGHDEPALLFLRKAVQLTPASWQYRHILIEMLSQSGLQQEVIEEGLKLLDVPCPLFVLLPVAGILYVSTKEIDESVARTIFGKIRRSLKNTLRQPEASQQLSPDDLSWGFITLGLCQKRLNRYADALRAFHDAVIAGPGNPEAYSARGRLQLERDQAGALKDFEQAIVLKTQDVLPYLVLAQEALRTGGIERALELCALLRRVTEKPQILASAWEFSAIAYALIGDRPAAEAAFRSAIQLDPTNMTLQENYQIFQQAGSQPAHYGASRLIIPPQARKEPMRPYAQAV